MRNIAIVSYEMDLHAHAIKRELDRRADVACEVIAIDSVIKNGGLNWNSAKSNSGCIRSLSGRWCHPSTLDVIWWRRFRQQPMQFPEWISDSIGQDFVANEWRSAMTGLLNTEFGGIWVNNPHCNARAGNKLYQIRLAERAGLRVPHTLVSQQPDEVRAFCAEHGGRVVAKKIAGSLLYHTVSVVVELSDLLDDDRIAACPTIYQQIVSSQRHLRVNCFGDSIHAFLIESEVFDWRRNLNVPFSVYRLDSEVQTKLSRLLDIAGLKMGIMDMMLYDDGEPAWIELNPQGQFLFCEAMTGYSLSERFAEFLLMVG